MVAWPADLKPLLSSYEESSTPATIRTQMDQGPAKIRRRTTAEIRNVSFGLLMTGTQLAALEEFFTNTTNGGVLPFTFEDPRTLAPQEARFTGPLKYSPLGADRWKTQVALEYLP